MWVDGHVTRVWYQGTRHPTQLSVVLVPTVTAIATGRMVAQLSLRGGDA